MAAREGRIGDCLEIRQSDGLREIQSPCGLPSAGNPVNPDNLANPVFSFLTGFAGFQDYGSPADRPAYGPMNCVL